MLDRTTPGPIRRKSLSHPPPDFESSEQTITLGSVHSMAHGLPIRPTRFEVVLRNTTATLGYATDDEIIHVEADGTGISVHVGYTVAANETNILFTMATTAVNIHRRDGSVGQRVELTATSWVLVGRGWK